MKKALFLAVVFIAGLLSFSYAAEQKGLMLDEFEVTITGGPQGTLDYGAGGGSNIEVSAFSDIKHGGKQSLKVTYDAVQGGYMWVAKGFQLDAANAGWQVKPEDIDWTKYNAISFWMYGAGSKTQVAFDIKDKGGEIWRYMTEDNFTGWKQIICPFKDFAVRSDWQPDSAEKNGTLDFPLRSYQFEPLPVSKGTLYFDDVELIKT